MRRVRARSERVVIPSLARASSGSSWRTVLVAVVGGVMLGGCFVAQEAVSGLKHLSIPRKHLVGSRDIAPAHALDRIEESPPVSAALRFGDHEGPAAEWALQPGARGVAAHVSPAPPLAFEWDFEESASFRADGWTVVAGDTAVPAACGRIDANRLIGARDLDPIIGGDYWRRSYWPGQSGECMVDTAGRRVKYVSPAIALGPGTRHISFLVGGGRSGGQVRLEVDGQPGSAFLEEGPGDAGMVRVDHVVPASAFGHQAHVVIEGFGGNGILVDDVIGSATAIEWQQPSAPLWGYVDLHNHVFNHLTSGGQLFVGRVTLHPLSGDKQAQLRAGDGIEHALEDCKAHHGAVPGNGVLSLSPEMGHERDGYPTFDGWPKATTLVHEQVYVDWLRRAWKGGLRIVQVDVGNTDFAGKVYATANFWLSHRHPFPRTDDEDAIDRTLDAIGEFVRGEGLGWAEVATSSKDARRIVGEGRLALVLGIEVDSMGDYYASCPKEPKDILGIGAPTCNTLPQSPKLLADEIHKLLKRLYLRGVSHIIPVHLMQNAFGFPAVYQRPFDIESIWANGSGLRLDNGWDLGVRYRLDDDQVQGNRLLTWLLSTVGEVLPTFDPKRMVPAIPQDNRYSHVAYSGLTPAGKEVIKQMMQLGMLVDIQHMGEKSADDALDLAEANHYPVMTSHTQMRDLGFGFNAPVPWDSHLEWVTATYDTAQVERIASEELRSREQLERIRRLGGMVGVELDTGKTAGHWGPAGQAFCDDSAVTWGNSYRYAVDKLGGRGLAIGSDANGLAGFPEPRFGPSACLGASLDDFRIAVMPAMAAAQRNGVRYDDRSGRMGVTDAGMGRFSKAGHGYAYTADERDAWEALAEAEVAADLPTTDAAFRFLDHYEQRAPWRGSEAGNRIRRLAKGFWVKEHNLRPNAVEPCHDECDDDSCDHPCSGPDLLEMDAYDAYPPRDGRDDERILPVDRVVDAWLNMQGSNPPIHKYSLFQQGPGGRSIERDFDVNLEGLAHYGLLPDFLQDNRNLGLTEQQMAPLFMGAEDYVEMWQRAEAQAAILGGPPPDVAGKPRGP
jgi:Membrane dipeptidase (Peptidase family M19)